MTNLSEPNKNYSKVIIKHLIGIINNLAREIKDKDKLISQLSSIIKTHNDEIQNQKNKKIQNQKNKKRGRNVLSKTTRENNGSC